MCLASLQVMIVCSCLAVPQCGCLLLVRRNDNEEKVQGSGVSGGWLQRRHQCLAGQHPPSHPWLLEVQQAVQTTVLSRRWRHLWKSSSNLRIQRRNLGNVRRFMEHLLLLRGASPMDTFELRFLLCRDSDERRMNLWVQHALMCRVRMIKLSTIPHSGFKIDNLPLVSIHLKTIVLFGVVLQNRFCDFSSCPSLEHLQILNCVLLSVKKIMSESLKCLYILECGFNQEQGGFRTHIYTPCLASLRLDDKGCPNGQLYRTPVLDSKPSLQKAIVRLVHYNEDCCSHTDSGNCGDENCRSCYGIEHDKSRKCVLLEGLSDAECLTLVAESRTFIFKRDLRHCPTFRKLKTLLLNDYWCVAPDFDELTCILKHSPVLEKLTLHLFSKGPKHKLRVKGTRHPMEISASISDYLKIVEVKCEVVDEKVIRVLKFMNTFNIRFSLDEVEILE